MISTGLAAIILTILGVFYVIDCVFTASARAATKLVTERALACNWTLQDLDKSLPGAWTPCYSCGAARGYHRRSVPME